MLASGFDSRVNDRANAMRWSRGGSRYNIAILIEFLTLKGIPYEVDLESERIGGPSAGLAFTLEVLDILTEGELTGGHKVAATGTMDVFVGTSRIEVRDRGLADRIRRAAGLR